MLRPLPFDLQRNAVYQLPSGHFVLLSEPTPNGRDVHAFMVNAKVMEYIDSGQMVLRASFLYAHARLCWTASDWQRRVNDVADEIRQETARRERIEVARDIDIWRAKAIDAEHAAQKAANRRLLRVAA
jgi:hypothetical protein